MPKLRTILTSNAIANLLKPTRYVQSIHDINLEELLNKGIKAIIIDLDDTIVPRLESNISEKSAKWIEKVKGMGFKIHIVSNGKRLKRVAKVAKDLNITGSGLGFKPFPYIFKRTLKKLAAQPKETAVIGDLLTTDVLGGNILGMFTILLKPMTKETSIIRIPYRLFEELAVRILGIKMTP